jgi:hypothetical protein
MLQPAAGPGFSGYQFRVAAAPDAGEVTATYIHFFAPRQSPDPRVANRMHGFLRSGGTEALIAHTRDENVETLAPGRERLNP